MLKKQGTLERLTRLQAGEPIEALVAEFLQAGEDLELEAEKEVEVSEPKVEVEAQATQEPVVELDAVDEKQELLVKEVEES